ncbi:unnamed protein product [Paramecium pentaurelia]|uniref:Uncharacterized protein n=1 Tax=Paramecium pentaurelia TaxID=43138 RepID=A0A8S1UHF3_9CILI|nr:unnamed protein product [Paramecium pentaurelia]
MVLIQILKIKIFLLIQIHLLHDFKCSQTNKKYIDSNYSRVGSMKSSDIDNISSNLSEQQIASFSKVSSNLLKISFILSIQRALTRY